MQAQEVDRYLRAKRNDVSLLWGYENRGKQYYWWKEAHSQGKSEDMMNWNLKTEWSISAQYAKVAKEYSEKLAGVELNGLVGFIDECNRFIIEPQFEPIDKLHGFSCGLAAVKMDGKYGFINKMGIWMIPPIYDYAENFDSNMLATVRIEKKYGAIDLMGDTLVPCHHLTEETMKYVPVKNKEYKSAVKLVSERLNSGFYNAIIDSINMSVEKIDALIQDSSYIVVPSREVRINKRGNFCGVEEISEGNSRWVLEPVYSGIQEIGEGLYRVESSDGVGIADSYGRILIPAEFEQIEFQKSERIFVVTKKMKELTNVKMVNVNRMGLYSMTGTLILPCIFDTISSFSFGLATASIENLCITLDIHGQVPDEYIVQLLEHGETKKENEYLGFCKRIIGLRPTCASAHNNLGIYLLNLKSYKEGIQRLKLAHKLDPGNEQIAENLATAKSERKDRRYNRVMNVLNVTGALLGATASAYATATNTENTNTITSTAYTSQSVSATSASTPKSKKTVKNSTSAYSDRDVKWMQANYRSQSFIYQNYEGQLIRMQVYPEKYNDAQRRQIQASMKKIRETIVSHGGTCTQSKMETWKP